MRRSRAPPRVADEPPEAVGAPWAGHSGAAWVAPASGLSGRRWESTITLIVFRIGKWKKKMYQSARDNGYIEE